MGGGQLGRMFAIAARRMGYRVHTFSPDEDTPTGQLADLEIAAPYEDREAVARFAQGVDVLTFEFENIPLPDDRVGGGALHGAALGARAAHVPASAAGEGISFGERPAGGALCAG